MSHSFALCAAAIFSNASRASLCAAARLGCRPGLTFLTGFPATTNPPVSASTVTATIRIFFMGPPLEAGIILQGRPVRLRHVLRWRPRRPQSQSPGSARSSTRGRLERLENRLGHQAIAGRAEMSTSVGVELRDVRVPGDWRMQIDEGDLQVLHDREDLPAGPVVFAAVSILMIAGLGGEIDEVEPSAPSAGGPARLVEDPAEQGEIDTRGVQRDLSDLQPQSLSQGPQSPEPTRSRHLHRVGLAGNVLAVRQSSQEGIALRLEPDQALTMVREQVVRESGEALLAVQIEGEVVPLRID